MNSVLSTLTITGFFANSAIGLAAPVFAIYVQQDLQGGSIAAAGFATSIYLVVKAVLQLFVARYTDGDEGCIREFWTAFMGYALFIVVPLLYLVISTVGQLYLVQALLGVAAAFAYPGWVVIFTRFTERQKEGREWTMFSTLVVLGSAAAAGVGGWIADTYGFEAVFVGWALLQASAVIAFAMLYRDSALLREGCVVKKRKHLPTMPHSC